MKNTSSIREEKSLGTDASRSTVSSYRTKENARKPNPMNFTKLKGFSKTRKKVRWSEEVDQALYGSEKDARQHQAHPHAIN